MRLIAKSRRLLPLVLGGVLMAGVATSTPASAAGVVTLPTTCKPLGACIAEDGFKVKFLKVTTNDEYVTFQYAVCPGTAASCGVPGRGLSNFRIELPEEGCLGDVTPVITTDTGVLHQCEVVDQDDLGDKNVCTVGSSGRLLGTVVKCEVPESAGDWGKNGEKCTKISLSYPVALWNDGTIKLGNIGVGTKASNDCFARTIVGPSCTESPKCVRTTPPTP